MMDDSPQPQQQERDAKAEDTSALDETVATESAATPEADTDTDAADAVTKEAPLDPLEQAQADANEWKDRALRAQAELENFRRRSARETQETVRFANARLLEDLLPVLDNFQLGLMAAAQDQSSMIYQGMSMVAKQLDSFLERQGLAEVSAEGKFDPSKHDAMEQEANDAIAEGEIIRVIRRGFVLKDRLLRPASVIVSSGPAAERETEAKVSD